MKYNKNATFSKELSSIQKTLDSYQRLYNTTAINTVSKSLMQFQSTMSKQLNNQEVRKKRYIKITRLVAAGICIFGIISVVRSMKSIKKEDPLRDIKRDLLVQRILIYVLAIVVVLARTSIFLWL